MPGNERFFAGLRERADRHGILLVIDEVQTGWGRTGKFWGRRPLRRPADILITAKGIASGFPLSAIAAPRRLMAQGLARLAGRHLRRQRRRVRSRPRDLDVIRDEKLVENAATQGAALRAALRTWPTSSPRSPTSAASA